MRVLLLLLLSGCVAMGADIISSDRLYPWTNYVGFRGGITNRTTVYTVLAASGGDDTAAISSALGSCPANQVVVLSNGTFNVNSFIDFCGVSDGVTLRGLGTTGANLTRVLTSGDYFYVRNCNYSTAEASESLISANATKGDFSLTFASHPTWVRTNQLVMISMLDGVDQVCCGVDGGFAGPHYIAATAGERRGRCQINKVVATNSTTVTFESPMHWDYTTAATAEISESFYDIATSAPIRGIGFENLKIESSSDGTAHAFFFENAECGYVKDCMITNIPGLAAIAFQAGSYRCEARGNYIVNSKNYGGGGNGYGVAFYNSSSQHLVTDNQFNHLHIGVNSDPGQGCVISYNYFTNMFADSGQSPGILLHGVHGAFNLLEGNFTHDKVGGDMFHGSAGYCTVFRNRVIGKGGSTAGTGNIPVIFQNTNRYMNIVGNVLGLTNFHTGYTAAASGASLVSCSEDDRNIIQIGCGPGSLRDDSWSESQVLVDVNGVFTNGANLTVVLHTYTTNDLASSYYLTTAPTNFGILAWPPYSPTMSWDQASPTNIPAGYRWFFGTNPPAASGDVGGSATINPPRLRKAIRLNAK